MVESMNFIPIFDTSAVLNLSKLAESSPLLARLRRGLPKRGSPLSYITVLELIYGVGRCEKARLGDSLRAISTAWRLSRGKVLLSPMPLVIEELEQIRDAGAHRSSANLERWLRAASKPGFKDELLSRKSSIDMERIDALFRHVRETYSTNLEDFLDHRYPDWRAERASSGSPLPEAAREKFKREFPFSKWKEDQPFAFTRAIGAPNNDATITKLRERCDAYFTFNTNLIRESLISGYRFERNSNDFHDGMQLLYLWRPTYCLVTDDTRFITRIERSCQRSRVMTVEQFASKRFGEEPPTEMAMA